MTDNFRLSRSAAFKLPTPFVLVKPKGTVDDKKSHSTIEVGHNQRKVGQGVDL